MGQAAPDDSVIVSVRNLSKKFCLNLRKSMFYGIMDLGKNLLGIRPDTSYLKQDEFWALDNISFSLRKSETLGVIGLNGAGKTTLLRMITGIFPPDRGEIRIRGTLGSLIALGAGFHPHMSGRENIFLNGSILGMGKKEILEKFESIAEFAEIGDFLDAPVSAYSSGMKVRLGFAVAIHCEPDILLIDEILSVGDLSFQNKCLRKLTEMRERAKGIIFVGHNLEHVRNTCTRVVILDHGKIVYEGDTFDGIAAYQDLTRDVRAASSRRQARSSGVLSCTSSGDAVGYIDSGILAAGGKKADAVSVDEPLVQFFDFELTQTVDSLFFSVGVLNEKRQPCIWVMSNDNDKCRFEDLTPGAYRLVVTCAEHHLMPGVYFPILAVRNGTTMETYERVLPDAAFKVTSGTLLERGIVRVHEQWRLIKR